MDELRIDDEITKQIFVSAFREDNLVPILGAGITIGMHTKYREAVPSGRQLKQYMINQIVKRSLGIGKEELESETFSSVAELFESNYVDVKGLGVSDYFYTHFTDVNINKPSQLRFLNEIDWSYIYTLNVDTGIEDSDRESWEVFYPNRDFDERKDFGGRKKLYKIHGDARSFIKTLDYNEMILSESQYIRSLNKNQKFHDMLAADCENKNILYIGCSLDDEIDIKYSVLSDKNRILKEKETCRIYVTAEVLSPLKKTKLEGYNISHFIQLQSNSDYELFYEFLYQCYQESIEAGDVDIENIRYTTPQRISKDLTENIRYLADINRDNQKLPYYFFERDIIQNIKLSTQKINVITGRRFVGKTMLAYNLLEHYQKYERFFVKAQESVDIKTLQKLMEQKILLLFLIVIL